MTINIGDYAPPFTSRSSFHPSVRLEHLAGRYIALTFIVGSAKPKSLELANLLKSHIGLFDDIKAMHFFVVIGESGEVKAGIAPQKPGFRVYFDKSGDIAALYGIGAESPKPVTFILSPGRRIIKIVTTLESVAHANEICEALKDKAPQNDRPAPVLLLSDSLEPRLCGELNGELKRLFTLEKATICLPPDSLTSDDLRRLIRLEAPLKNEQLNETVIRRIMSRIIPEVKRSFNYNPEHIDDLIFISQRALEGGRADPMRYSEIKSKEHIRFCILLCITEGNVTFPEFSTRPHTLKAGDALIFSSGLLVEMPRVLQGEANYVLGLLGTKPAPKK